MSDSVRPHRWQPTRLPCPWDSPGNNTGVGCHFLLQCMKVKSQSVRLCRTQSQSCQTLHDPMDCSLPGSSAHGIFQARVLEWGAIAYTVLELSNSEGGVRPAESTDSGLLITYFWLAYGILVDPFKVDELMFSGLSFVLESRFCCYGSKPSEALLLATWSLPPPHQELPCPSGF